VAEIMLAQAAVRMSAALDYIAKNRDASPSIFDVAMEKKS